MGDQAGDPLADIIAIRQLQEDLMQLRQARIDEASEGFGQEIMSTGMDALSMDQQRQGLEFLSKQYTAASRQETELKSGLLDMLTKHIETEESSLSTWAQQCETSSKAFDSFEAALHAEIVTPSSPRSPSQRGSQRSPKLSPRLSGSFGEGPLRPIGAERQSMLNFGVLKNKRKKVREVRTAQIDNTSLLDDTFSRLRSNAQAQSFQDRYNRIAIEHLLLPYFYELGMYAEVAKEQKEKKQAKPAATAKPAAAPKPAVKAAVAKPAPGEGKPPPGRTPSKKPAVPRRVAVPPSGRAATDNKENPRANSTATRGTAKPPTTKPGSRPGSGNGVRRPSTDVAGARPGSGNGVRRGAAGEATGSRAK